MGKHRVISAMGNTLRRAVTRSRFYLLVLAIAGAIAGILFLLPDTGHTSSIHQVDLRKRSNLPPVQQMSGIDYGEQEGVLRVAIAGVTSPTRTLDIYQELLHFMGSELGRKVRLVLKPSFAEINDMVRGGRVDIAFVCSLAYVEGNRDFGMELLAAPRIKGTSYSYSYLIVPQDSTITNIKSLKGHSFSFADPLSNSGYLVPIYQLSLIGETPTSFFNRYTFTYSHDNSVIAVANKLVDAASVDSLVYDHLNADDPGLVARTKIIARWGPYGTPPIVVNRNLDLKLKIQLQEFFLSLNLSQKGREILNDLNIDRFVIPSHDDYNSIQEMMGHLGY